MKQIPEFKYWVQKTFPAIYDDSLSYYELLTKIISHLNEIGSLTNSLAKQLKDTIEWMLNDGVEEEVINKLNEWLADGTMDLIVNENVFNELNKRINEIGLSVKLFGAKGDGSTNDTASITNAINFALDNGFKKVVFPAGLYAIDTALTLKGGLIYEGAKATLKQMRETAYITITESEFTIKGLTFDASNLVMRALFINGSQNFTIEDCIFRNGTKYGLHAYNVKKGFFDKCIFEMSGRNDFMSASFALNGTNNTVTRCEASGNVRGNGFIQYSDNTNLSSNNTYSDCTAKANRQHGFCATETENVANRVFHPTYINCVADGNGQENPHMFGGIVIHHSDGAIVSGCTAINNKEHGITVMDSDNVSIVNNICKSNKRCGIRLQADWSRLPQDVYSGVKKCMMEGNQCLNNGIEDSYWSSGILIEGNCHYITCNNNIIFGNYYSIYTKKMDNFSDCTNVYLENNVMYGNRVSNNLFNTMVGGSVLGENFVSGSRVKIDRILSEQDGYIAYNLSDVLTNAGILSVVDKATYYVTSGSTVEINGLDRTDYPVGTSFYVGFRGFTSNGSITINTGNGITVPNNESFVISQEKGNQDFLYKFVKTAGTPFRLEG